MEVDEYIDEVHGSLLSSGLEPTDTFVAGRSALAGRRSDFRWRWFGSRLHTAVLVTRFEDGAGRDMLDAFLAAAVTWAVEHRGGGSLGLQSGVAAVAAVVMPDLSPQARAWATEPHGRRFAAVAYPVAVGLGRGEVVQPKRMLIGAIFTPFLRGLVGDVLGAPLATG